MLKETVSDLIGQFQHTLAIFCIFALRHTVHHHGQLAALASYNGYEGGSWDL